MNKKITTEKELKLALLRANKLWETEDAKELVDLDALAASISEYQNNMLIEDELSTLLITHPKIKAELLDLLQDNHDSVIKWLNKPRIQLLNKTPLSVLATNPQKVSDLIYTIKTGDFS